MTIIRQKKDNNVAQRWIVGLAIGAACAVIGGIFFYNQSVNGSHEMAQHKSELRDMEVKNAELKSALYALTDTQKVRDFAASNGLVVEKNPQYVRRQEASITMR